MNDGDSNAFYCGWMIYTSDPDVWYPWMSYLTFTTPVAPKAWNNSSKLILKLKVGEGVNQWAKSPGKMRAFLSKDFMENSDPAGLANINIIEQSYIYNSENNIAENRQTEPLSGWTYFVFSGQNIEPGTTYYIYLYPYKSDDDAPENATFNGGGTAIGFKNYPGLAYCYITT
jgi:hypothetical protein